MTAVGKKSLPEVLNWMDVNDDMPDDSIDVLVFGVMCDTDKTMCVWPGYFDSADDCWRCSHGNEIEKVTHWADMPEGPELPK